MDIVLVRKTSKHDDEDFLEDVYYDALQEERNSLFKTLSIQRRTYDNEQCLKKPNKEIIEILQSEILLTETKIQVNEEKILEYENNIDTSEDNLYLERL